MIYAPGANKGTPRQRKRRAPFSNVPSASDLRHRQTGGSFSRTLPTNPYTPAPSSHSWVPNLPILSPTISTTALRSLPYLSNLPTPAGVTITPTPEAAYRAAIHENKRPSRAFRLQYGLPMVGAIEHARLAQIDENLGEPEDITHAIELASLATGVGGLAVALKGGLKGAAAVGAETLAKEAAGQAASTATKEGLAAALGRAGSKAEPAFSKAARQALGDAAKKLPEPVKAAAKIGGRGAGYPLRHPFTAPVALQAPAAAIHGDPSQFVKGLEGKGTYADALGTVSGVLSHVSPLLGEATNLPATVLPSLFLTARAGVSAAQGNSSEANKLLDEWKKTGVLPAIFGHGLLSSQTANALKTHPLYSGLELAGGLTAADRIAGAGARTLRLGDLGALGHRPGLAVEGTPTVLDRGNYSKALFRNLSQRRTDRTTSVAPDTIRGQHVLKEAINRQSNAGRAVETFHTRENLKALKDLLPRRGVTVSHHGHTFGKLDRASGDLVALGVERIFHDPTSFATDLPAYKRIIEDAAKQKDEHGLPLLGPDQLKMNKANVKILERGIKSGDHGDVVKAANAFIELQQPILDEMAKLKLITHDQAAKASAIPYARIHMNAQHGRPNGVDEQIAAVKAQMKHADSPEMQGRLLAKVQKLQKQTELLDEHGNPLSLEAITAHMQARGIEPPGFLSHRTPSAGDYFRPSLEGGMLEKGSRTGASFMAGTQLGGIEGLARQLRRAQGLVDRAKHWNDTVTKYGIVSSKIKTMGDFRKALLNPEAYGLDPGMRPVAVRRYPFAAKKAEIEGALEHQDPVGAEDLAAKTIHDNLDEGMSGAAIPDSTEVVVFPEMQAKQLRADAAPSPGALKIFQAGTNVFKRAVLPFSPGFYIGNGFDNALRTAFAGISPTDFIQGAKLEHALSPEEKNKIAQGAFFSSVENLAPHRSIENVVTANNKLAESVRSAAMWAGEYGAKQWAVKALPKGIAAISHYMLATNAYLTEVLPQRGILGKLAREEYRATGGSLKSSFIHMDEIAKDFAKGIESDPAKLIRTQKDLEQVLGNYNRMSPAARKVISNVMPFWSWSRAAYKFVYLTMPLHHTIQTALLTAAGNMTRAEREKFGLDKLGEKPLPGYMQGALPLKDGSIIPTASFNSFGYAAEPVALSKGPFSQISNTLQALGGTTWKGTPIVGGESAQIKAGLISFFSSFIPGANDLIEEKGGHYILHPHLTLIHNYPKGYVEYAREPKQTITVPATGSGGGSSSGGVDYGKAFNGGSGGSEIDYGRVFSGG